mmetsp:Transcript_11416/g.44144  ORF Transcript_11416/g.44144 Transcript_11416/m.44144 type:complete len:202 (+) Transcript_11416:916-1521(+)
MTTRSGGRLRRRPWQSCLGAALSEAPQATLVGPAVSATLTPARRRGKRTTTTSARVSAAATGPGPRARTPTTSRRGDLSQGPCQRRCQACRGPGTPPPPGRARHRLCTQRCVKQPPPTDPWSACGTRSLGQSFNPNGHGPMALPAEPRLWAMLRALRSLGDWLPWARLAMVTTTKVKPPEQARTSTPKTRRTTMQWQRFRR